MLIVRHCLIPVNLTGDSIVIAISDPKNKKALEEVKSVTGLTVEPIAAPEPSIRAAISLYYGD